MRQSKIDYYLNIAREVASRSPCSRRHFGAILVKNDAIISSGYNGTVRGALNCGIDVPCLKDISGEVPYTSYLFCPAVHAEENAVLIAGRNSALGSTMYLAPRNKGHGDRPCHNCRRRIIQAGVEDIYFIGRDGEVVHEVVEDYITMENEWIMEILDEYDPDWMTRVLS